MNTMKKIVILVLCLTILLMITPNMRAYAASGLCTSKSFVVRNWKGEVEAPTDEVLPDDEEPPADEPEEIEPEKPAGEPVEEAEETVNESADPVVDIPEEPDEQGAPTEDPAESDDDHTDEEYLPPEDVTIPSDESEGEEGAQGEQVVDDHNDRTDEADADGSSTSEPITVEIEQSVPGTTVDDTGDFEPEPSVEAEGDEEVAPVGTEEPGSEEDPEPDDGEM